MNLFIENCIFRVCYRLPLGCLPDKDLPSFVKATTLGVSLLPSSLIITFGSPPSMIATTELVVPIYSYYFLCHIYFLLVEFSLHKVRY